MPKYLHDEEIIRSAWNTYQYERMNCDEINSFVAACMELLRLERQKPLVLK